MQALIDGYRQFRAGQWPERRAVFERLADRGQSPRAAVVACGDSRVDPAMIFGAGPGELFVIRNVANLVPPYAPDERAHATSAAIEFAVLGLEVRDLIVMGHAMCGGIRKLLTGTPRLDGGFLEPWLALAEPAKRRALACDPVDLQTETEFQGVKLALENLMTFPFVAERVADQRLTLHGASFDIRSGVLSVLRPDGVFAPA